MINKNNNKIKSKETVPAKAFAGAEKLLDHIQLTFSHEMKTLITSYFESMDDILLQIADKSDSHKKQKLYSDSLKSIRVYKLNVLSSFLKSLKQTFTLFRNKKFIYFEDKITKVIKKDHSVTAPIDKDDVVEKLAQNALIHESETLYQNHISAFEKRFSLLISRNLNPYQIPVGPYVLVSSFAKSIRLLHLDLNIKLILYKHFERNVISQLNDLYTKINRYLNNNGVVTGLENNIVTKQLNIQEDAEIDNNLSPQDLSRAGNAPDDRHIGPAKITKDFIFDTLIILQQQTFKNLSTNNLGISSPEEIKNTLLAQLKQSQQPIEQQDKDTITLVTMLFQLIIENRNIPEPIQLILTKLHIPFIKAAIQDNSLLTNKLHPAQILLDLISKTSVGWSAKLDTNNRFMNQLNQTVEVILSENNFNEKFFKVQLSHYQKFIKFHKNNFAIEQKRVKEKSMGKEKIAAAMKTVEALLAYKMEDRPMPTLVKNTLLGPWKNLLALLLVRHSDTSDKYLQMVKFIDDLMKALESKQFEIVVQKNIDALCNEFEEGLKLVAYNGKELNDKKEEFYLCLLKWHKLDDRRKDMNFVPEQTLYDQLLVTPKQLSSPVKKIDYSNHTHNLKGLSEHDEKALANIKIGKWLEFSDENNMHFTAKLSWISPRSGKFLFVNAKGLKTIDKTPQELTSGLKDKSIKVVKKPD